MKPRLLDLFCGAGGATRGYQLAGFHEPAHRTVTQVADAALEARMAAQQAGWVVRRLRAGVDLCPACREAAA